MQELYLEGKKDEAAAALPAELIDAVSLPAQGPPGMWRPAPGVCRDAGVGTLADLCRWRSIYDGRLAQLRHLAELAAA